jgi:hypothetical protein
MCSSFVKPFTFASWKAADSSKMKPVVACNFTEIMMYDELESGATKGEMKSIILRQRKRIIS